MCGIVGLINPDSAIDQATLCEMRDALTHRGPDDAGIWAHGGVGLAHRRLSVVDLSDAGHQPMKSADGNWIIVFNGEVYNFEQLKQQLGPREWRGSGDTEIIVEAFATWGVEAALKKPLYYGWAGDQFVFSSELTALRSCQELDLDRDALASYLRHGYVPAPHSVYTSMHKLMPGHLCRIDTKTLIRTALPPTQPYWSLQDHAVETAMTEQEAEQTLLGLLREAVGDRLVADVPLGAFLSGGYDSSLVSALMQEASDTTTKAFTIGFDDARYNEAQHAKEIAAHLGTQHTELYVAEADLLNAVDQLPALCDEPFADSSILPTYLVSHLARRDVTVALSGDGGDELF
jgi:asparagine synthase (glutamine-hydrolysing)